MTWGWVNDDRREIVVYINKAIFILIKPKKQWINFMVMDRTQYIQVLPTEHASKKLFNLFILSILAMNLYLFLYSEKAQPLKMKAL